jgi:hypothetical protein
VAPTGIEFFAALVVAVVGVEDLAVLQIVVIPDGAGAVAAIVRGGVIDVLHAAAEGIIEVASGGDSACRSSSGSQGGAIAGVAIDLDEAVFRVVIVVMQGVVGEVSRSIVGVSVDAVGVGRTARIVAGEGGVETNRTCLVPAISEAVVVVSIGRRTTRGTRASAVGRKVGTREAVELVVLVVPVAVDAVVCAGYIAVGLVSEAEGIDSGAPVDGGIRSDTAALVVVGPGFGFPVRQSVAGDLSESVVVRAGHEVVIHVGGSFKGSEPSSVVIGGDDVAPFIPRRFVAHKVVGVGGSRTPLGRTGRHFDGTQGDSAHGVIAVEDPTAIGVLSLNQSANGVTDRCAVAGRRYVVLVGDRGRAIGVRLRQVAIEGVVAVSRADRASVRARGHVAIGVINVRDSPRFRVAGG